jgi:hypothetical protein
MAPGENSHAASFDSSQIAGLWPSNVHSSRSCARVGEFGDRGTPQSPAVSPLYIHDDSGGQIGSYLRKYSAVRMSGHHVVVDGTCASACTILLGAIPRNRICVTKNAVLAFHSAWNLTLTGVVPIAPARCICGRTIPTACATGFPDMAVYVRRRSTCAGRKLPRCFQSAAEANAPTVSRLRFPAAQNNHSALPCIRRCYARRKMITNM